MTPPDVVVVGGGTIGLACAWRLAERGVAVWVFAPELGGEASSVAAGMLAPVTEARPGEEESLCLGLASLARWAGLVADLERTVGSAASFESISFRADGTVLVGLDADDRAALADLVDRQRSLGLDVADLSARELRDVEPALAPGVRRGALAAAERSVDPAALVAVLRVAAERAGTVVRRQRVAALTVVDDRRVVGVELVGGERISAGTVVLAAGAWSGGLAGLPAAGRPPVRPVKGQVLTLRQRPGDMLVRHTVRGFARGSFVYLVPRTDGRIVCGATMEERGWDDKPTAGGAYQLLRDVLALFPGLDDTELLGVRAGFRPGSPDDLPLIGPGTVEGLVIATGHHRNGILLTPITAEAVAALLLGEPLPAELLACDPRRFTRPSRAGVSTTGR